MSATEASPAPTETAQEAECSSITSPQGFILQSSWRLVMASRGESDHQEMVDNFADYAKDMAQDTKHDDNCLDVNVLAAKLSLEAALLVAEVLTSDYNEATKSEYKTVAAAGNDLMEGLGFDNKF